MGSQVPIRRPLFWILCGVALLGLITVGLGVRDVLRPSSTPYYPLLLTLAAIFAILSPLTVRLPSGANWRPAMAMVTSSIFLLPPDLAALVAFPGLVLLTSFTDNRWWAYPLTFGHISLGLYAGIDVFRLLAPAGVLHLPAFLPAVAAGLIVHLSVNRLVSAMIVSCKKGVPFVHQLRLNLRELNWGYFNFYLTSLIAAIMYVHEGLWGLLLTTVLLYGMYQAVSYYSQMQLWQQAANIDGLTGVGNRVAWENFVVRMHQHPTPGTLAVVDLDNLKTINDRYGHAVGDELIRTVAKKMHQQLRKSDRLFRFGGDEFILFCPHEAGEADIVRTRITFVTDQIALIDNIALRIRASIGLASFPEEAEDFDALFSLADNRMYRNKFEHKLSEAQGENDHSN
ncbi:MAG: hypothetical protein JWN30_49 [Bacilli bacterium]|nr:hypothetical protein [Bacilli bacterium]